MNKRIFDYIKMNRSILGGISLLLCASIYCGNISIWKKIHKYDKFEIFKPLWQKILYRKLDNEVIKLIKNAVVNDKYHNEYNGYNRILLDYAFYDEMLYKVYWTASSVQIKNLLDDPIIRKKFVDIKIENINHTPITSIKITYEYNQEYSLKKILCVTFDN